MVVANDFEGTTMIRRIALAAALTATLAGCSSDPSAPAGGDAVAWAEKVCSSVESEVAVLSQSPDIDPGDPKQAKDNLITYLTNFSIALDRMATGIRDAGAPPVTEGPQAVDRVTKAIQDAKKGVDDAKTNLEKADVANAEEFQAAYTKVGEDMAKLAQFEDPTKDLKANKELNDAFDKAAACKRLEGSGN
jgi:hypothetical protein